jgi:hypothetical protein
MKTSEGRLVAGGVEISGSFSCHVNGRLKSHGRPGRVSRAVQRSTSGVAIEAFFESREGAPSLPAEVLEQLLARLSRGKPWTDVVN